MIPSTIQEHLTQHHPGYEHHHHQLAGSAQELAAAEHVTGYRVAKPVIVRVRGQAAIAVVSAAQRVRLGALEEAMGAPVELVPEDEFARWFGPCERGAEPALAMFGLPILVDAHLAGERKIVMPAGTHEDAVVLDVERWLACERAQTVPDLGAPIH
jgi:Ala-tRNA(Pro) deacylase